MRKSLFLYKVKPPTPKTFNFFSKQGYHPIFLIFPKKEIHINL